MLEIIQAAGWPAFPLIFASVIALALIIERFLALRASKIIPAGLYEETISTLKNQEISPDLIAHLSQHSPLGQLLGSGLRQYLTQKNLDSDTLQTEIQKTGRKVTQDLERYMTPLGTIASIAPLMGLFGTVIGMIEIFAAGAATNTQQMASGIAIALYNTALGLVIAIPCLIFWRHFRRKIDEYVLELEQLSSRFAQIILNVKQQQR